MNESNGRHHGHDIIVIGASAGGLEPLMTITRALPADLAAAVFVVLHGGSEGVLPELLSRAGELPAEMARDGQRIVNGMIYVAPSDRHLLIQPGRVRVTRGPKENRFRPAIDPLFRTAARAYGPRTVGVILSGALDDGAHGMFLIKRLGGKAVVQDPYEAFAPSMPRSACQATEVDFVVPSAEIPAILARLSQEPPNGNNQPVEGAMDPDDNVEPDIAENGSDALANALYPGSPSSFTCPECGGALWELNEGEPARYRCHVGHGFTADSLLAEQDQNLELVLWAAVRALDENAALCRRMGEKARQRELTGLENAYQKRGVTAQQQANVIRSLLVAHEPNSVGFKLPKRVKAVPQKPEKRRAHG